MLTFGTEVRSPADIMYGSLNEPPSETYDDYVDSMRERMTTAYEETRAVLWRAAERNKRYYDIRVRAKQYKKGQWVCYFNPRKFVGRQDKWERKYNGPSLIVDTPSPVTVQLQRRKGAKTMTVHIEKVKPFLVEVPKSGLADKPTSDVRELPERADEEIFVKAANTEPVSEQVSAKSADNELIDEPELEEESALSTNIGYEVDSTRPAERPRREVRAPKYLDEHVRLVPANGEASY